MTTRTLSWALLSGFGLFGFAGAGARAQSHADEAGANGARVEQASSGVGGAAEQTGRHSGRAADDASLATDVKAELVDSGPGANEIRVEARDGVVTLAGTVESQAAKQSAVSLASQMAGASHVEDRLKVENP